MAPPARSADVIVIGGGIVGVSSAAHLAATGRRVVLLERTGLAAGASGRNSGVVQHPFDSVLAGLHLETLGLYRALAETRGSEFTLPAQPVGLLMATHDPDLAERVTRALSASHPDLSPAFLAPGAARALEPSLAGDVAACRLAIGYPVAPAAATRAYAAWATDLGVEIRIGVAARPWMGPDGRVAGVELADGGRLSAPDVVVAAGPWTPEVVDPGGSWRPIRPLWGVVVSVSLADRPTHVLEEAEIDIEPGSGRAEIAEGLEAGHSFSLVTAAEASSLGSTFLDGEPDPTAHVPSLVARGATFVPGISAATIGAYRVCARPLSSDGRPLVGRVPGVDGLWVAAGHGPWGISTGPASGRLIAELIDGRIGASPPALDPGRFAGPRLSANRRR